MSSSVSSNYEITPLDCWKKIFEFLDYKYPDIIHLCSTNKSSQVFRATFERLLFSQISIFDRSHWGKYWNAEITDKYDSDKIDPRILRAFLKTYFGQNPNGSGKVKDNCLTPVVKPAKVKFSGVMLDYSLNVAELLSKQPKIGPAAKYQILVQPCEPLEQYGNKPEKKDELIILLKGVVARNKPWSEQVEYLKKLKSETRYECEIEPDAPSQNLVLLAHHALTRELPFGDKTGMEGQDTYGRTRELVRIGNACLHMVSGGFNSDKNLDPYKPPAPAGLVIYQDVKEDFASESDGVGIMQKF